MRPRRVVRCARLIHRRGRAFWPAFGRRHPRRQFKPAELPRTVAQQARRPLKGYAATTCRSAGASVPTHTPRDPAASTPGKNPSGSRSHPATRPGGGIHPQQNAATLQPARGRTGHPHGATARGEPQRAPELANLQLRQ